MSKRFLNIEKWILGVILSVLLQTVVVQGAEENTESPKERAGLELFATSAVLMDGESGRILYEKKGQEPMANASTTKVLSCILILEHCELTETATVSEYASQMPKVKLSVKKGERYLVEDLLFSLMLESHNDSAVVLAEHLGKELVPELTGREAESFSSEESRTALKAFAKLMNDKALEIGCKDTYFITPNGLDATETLSLQDGTIQTLEHHTTAEDLARIMAYAILRSPKKEEFLRITRTNSHSFFANGRQFSCANHNAFLGMMEGALSGKTGFTGKAGYCYVGSLLRDGRYYVVALLACGWPNNRTYKWTDTRKLMEYGLQNFRRVILNDRDILFPEDRIGEVAVLEGQGASIGETPKALWWIPERAKEVPDLGVLLGPKEQVEVEVDVPEAIPAPVQAGEVLGEIRYLVGDQIYYREEIVAKQDVLSINFSWCLHQVLQLFTKKY